MICICGHIEEDHLPTDKSTYCCSCYKDVVSGSKEILVDTIWHDYKQDNLKYLEMKAKENKCS